VTSLVLPRVERGAAKLGVPLAEAHVHDAVAQLGEELLPRPRSSGTFVLVHELELPYARPDIVAAVVDLRAWQARRDAGIAPCTAPLPLRFALALSAKGGSARLDELVPGSASRGDRSRARDALAALMRKGWTERCDDLFVLRLVPNRALEIVSGVEAKLNNWRRAVSQVHSWESHVDAVLLAFPQSYLPHVPRTQPLRRFGLIGVEDEDARLVRKPTGPRARGIRRALTEEFLYSRWLRQNGSEAAGDDRNRLQRRASERTPEPVAKRRHSSLPDS
jgi:hypothetical protein